MVQGWDEVRRGEVEAYLRPTRRTIPVLPLLDLANTRALKTAPGRTGYPDEPRCVAICQMLSQGSRTVARRSPYGISAGSSIDRAPALIARR